MMMTRHRYHVSCCPTNLVGTNSQSSYIEIKIEKKIILDPKELFKLLIQNHINVLFLFLQAL